MHLNAIAFAPLHFLEKRKFLLPLVEIVIAIATRNNFLLTCTTQQFETDNCADKK